MPEAFASPAIVLVARDQGESDRLVTFYSKGGGKVRGIAKGAKRSRHRFVNALEPFTLVHLVLAPPRTSGLARVERAEVLESFPPLRTRIQGYACASLCSELVDLWTREADAQEALFDALLWHLRAIAFKGETAALTLFFQARLLTLVGYAPEWGRCLHCNLRPAAGRVPFGAHPSGPICGRCHKDGQNPSALSLGALRTLHHIQSSRLDRLDRLKVSEATLAECWNLVMALHCHHLQRRPAAYAVLEDLGYSVTSLSIPGAGERLCEKNERRSGVSHKNGGGVDG